MNPIISVVIPTRNRASDLHVALTRLCHQTLPPESYEVLVVDNGSTDNTRRVVATFEAQSDLFRYLYEPNPGANRARNRGAREAQGKYIAFTDDDALVPEGWLAAMLMVLERESRIGLVGGRVTPVWQAPRPPWLKDWFLGFVAALDHGDRARELADQPAARKQNMEFLWYIDTKLEFLWSVNMACPRHVLEQVGYFPINNGRTNDEILVQLRMQRAGFTIFYDPSIEVAHPVPPSRLTKTWFWRRGFDQGYSDCRLQQALGNLGWGPFLFNARCVRLNVREPWLALFHAMWLGGWLRAKYRESE